MKRLIKTASIMLMFQILVNGIVGYPSIAESAETITLTVCPTCPHTTITSAIQAANAGDTIKLLMASAHTEANIYINKDVTIEGGQQYHTIVQAAAAPASGEGNVFTVASNQIVTMRDFTIQNGSPQLGLGLGGAISMLSASNVTLERMTIRHNRAAGGGGINNDDGVLTLSQVSIYDNLALGSFGGSGTGGGIASSGTTYLTNVTISENESHLGGGLYQCGGQVSLTNVTVTGNNSLNNSVPGSNHDGGGVYIADCLETVATLRSSIIAGNSVENGMYPDCKGTFNGGFSLIENQGPLFGTRCGMSGFTSGMIYDMSAQFGAVSGVGYARSYSLSSSSPAIDAGACHSATGPTPSTDQRNYVMPVDGNSSGSAECDMGSYEFNSVPTAIYLTQNSAGNGVNQSLSLLTLLLVATTIIAKRVGQPKSYCRLDQAA